MEPARLGTASRRPRRGSVERPIDMRLVRKVALVLIAPFLLLILTINRSGPLPVPALPPAFDAETAVSLTEEFTRDIPSRVPGSPGADDAADWVREKLALYGLETREDVWREDVPGVGDVELRNLVSVVQGTLDETIVVVAHRDNNGRSAGANDNASGTAALIELARPYARVGTTESARTPLHTLVFLSTDAGAYGSLGAARFATRSPLAERSIAVVSLDGLGGAAEPRLELAGLGRRSPPAAFVRTAESRIAAEDGRGPLRPGVLSQLVSLALPFGYGEQAPLLGVGVPALRITTASDAGTPSGGDELEGIDRRRLGELGRASESLLGSLDGAVELPGSTDGAVFLDGRVVRGWALQLLLVAAVLPFAAAALDLLSRCRLRRLPLVAAWRALRRRVGVWLVLVALVGLAALVGALPDGPSLPPPPDQPPVDSWPFGVLVVLAVVAALVWLRARAALVPRVRATPEEELAGYAVAFVALLLVCAGAALVSPYTLVFVLPSLYAWLCLPQLRRAPAWVTDVVFGLGLIGPVLSLVVLAEQLGLGVRAPLYAAALVTTGVVPWASTLAFAAWGAVASLVGAIAAGRYAPVSRSSGR
jgi:Peptidase family M28